LIPSSVKSSSSYKPRAALKKSATTENVTNYLLNSDSSDPPSTIIKSCQKRFREFGSDERKIISGFLSTPLLIIKTPGNTLKDLPRSPLQKITRKSNLGLFSEGSSFLVKETSSIESIKFNETLLIEETMKETSEINQTITSSNNNNSSNIVIPNTSLTFTSITQTIMNSRKEREHESFQSSIKARILEERQRIETQAALQARKIQKLKAGPTSLPVKSTKPLTIPKGFQLGCDERAQLKKLQSKSQTSKHPVPVTVAVPKVIKPTIAQKFTPTIPKSPLFASKLRAEAKAEKEKEKERSGNKDKENNLETNTTDNSNINNTASTKTALELRKKLEYRPLSIPRSPKFSSINRNQNRILNQKKNINSSDNNKN
jgi:hypothetical protein